MPGGRLRAAPPRAAPDKVDLTPAGALLTAYDNITFMKVWLAP
jgi:hypothetical protein